MSEPWDWEDVGWWRKKEGRRAGAGPTGAGLRAGPGKFPGGGEEAAAAVS